MVDFQQQSTQRLIYRYEHMNRHRNRKILRLKGVQVEYYSTENLIRLKQYLVNSLYFDPLQFFRHERSVAPSIFNIKERGLAQCILWLKLS